MGSHTERLGHCVAGLGEYYVDAIRPVDIRSWLLRLNNRYAPSVCNGCPRILRQVLDELVEDELLRSNPARRVRALHEPRTLGARGQVLTHGELGGLLRAADELYKDGQIAPDVLRLLKCAAWTGCRKGELLALRWDDLRGGELRVERSVWRGLVKSTKTNDPRIVAVAPPLGAVFKSSAGGSWRFSTLLCLWD